MNNTQIHETLEEFIISLVKNTKPETVDQLVKLIQEKHALPQEQITRILLKLETAGKIGFISKEPPFPSKFNEYVFSSKATWLWLTIALAIATTIAAFTIPEDFYPLIYLRYVLGSIFVLWLPGYTFIKALFPRTLPIRTSTKDLDTIERIVLSLGMSLALVPIVGLLLNYTPWGIRLTPIILSLLTMTIVFSAAAITREYKTAPQEAEKSNALQNSQI